MARVRLESPSTHAAVLEIAVPSDRGSCRRSKERGEAADAHYEGKGEQAEFVSGRRGAHVALQHERNLAFLFVFVGLGRLRVVAIVSELVSVRPSLAGHLLAVRYLG